MIEIESFNLGTYIMAYWCTEVRKCLYSRKSESVSKCHREALFRINLCCYISLSTIRTEQAKF